MILVFSKALLCNNLYTTPQDCVGFVSLLSFSQFDLGGSVC